MEDDQKLLLLLQEIRRFTTLAKQVGVGSCSSFGKGPDMLIAAVPGSLLSQRRVEHRVVILSSIPTHRLRKPRWGKGMRGFPQGKKKFYV